MPNNNFELYIEVQRCIEIYNTGIFVTSHPDTRNIFMQSAFIELLIRLNHILQALNDDNQRISWSDDINTSNGINDITDLINKLRNAACHIPSRENHLDDRENIKFRFNRLISNNPKISIMNGAAGLTSDYADDVAFFYGSKRIYLKRHIKRLLEELKTIIKNF